MPNSWGYPDVNVRVLTPEETDHWQRQQEGGAEPTGETMVEIKRGIFVQPRSVIAVETYDNNSVRIHTRNTAFNVPGTVESILDRLDCRTFRLPSPTDEQD